MRVTPKARAKASARTRAWYAAHKKTVLAQKHAQHLENPEKDNARTRAWRLENPEANRAWRLAHPARAKMLAQRYRHSLKGRLAMSKSNARHAGRVWELTDEEARALFSASCAYCGYEGFGIDRVDSALGYTLKNSVPCCTRCNKAKSDLSRTSFLEMCERIVAHQRKLKRLAQKGK